ncbi:MAG TPA: ABC transporter permease [Bryobacteraceae bacterium]|jgi:predicted permease|nr:ABC transporter permease [Bryobacteraceae bacterium]
MTLWRDVRIAFRQLRRSPGFTLVVLATLGLCIGVNTAIYSVLDAVLLRPAPYPQPDRLAMVTTEYWHNGGEYTKTRQTGSLFEAVRDGAPDLDVAASSAGESGANFSAPGHLEYIRQQRVSAGYFGVLGVPPQYGREFLRTEDVAGGPAITVLSFDFWQRVFQANPAVLGKAITLRGEPHTVVGIMPKEFHSNVKVDLWTPLRPSRRGEGGGSNYLVLTRLKPGVSWARANEQLKALSNGIKEGTNLSRDTRFEERVVPLQSGLTGDVRSELLMTWAAVLAVLLIGCVNIAGLLMARSATRSREIATRMALGGGRVAIVRQLLVESLLLALGGCAAGVCIGTLAIVWLERLGARDLELWHPIAIDTRVMLAMLGIAFLTSLVFGLMPALSASRLDIRSVLSEGGRGVAGGRRHWPRQALVACEVALTLVLLVSAGLLVRTLGYLNGLNPGFDARNVITAQASLEDARYNTSAAVNRLFTRSLERIRLIPGVQNAAVALTLPYERPLNDSFKTLDGDDRDRHQVEVVYSTPSYFEAMRIPMLRGRAYRDSDTPDSSKVVVVSESFAARYFHGLEAVGHHLDLGGGEATEIVGVAGDVQQNSGLDAVGPLSIEPTIYRPASQVSDGFFRMIHAWFPPKWVVRATGPAGSLTAQIQSAVASVDSQLPIARFQSIDDLQALNTKGQRYDAALFSILASLALLLAAIGLYGLISQSIAQRTHELGIRLALGATAQQAMVNAIKPGILLALAGVAAGGVLSRVAVGFLEHLLFGIRSTDPLTLAATAGILLLVTVLASLIPALRILRLDPARTLRNE